MDISLENAGDDVPEYLTYPSFLNWQLNFPIKSLTALLEEAVVTYPHHPCLHFMDKKLTYTEVGFLVNQIAAGLQAQGVNAQSRVGLFMPNTPYYVLFYFAILKAGGVVVNFNPLYAVDEIKHQLEDSETTFMVTLNLQALVPKLLTHLHQTPLKKIILCPLQDMLPFPKNYLFLGFKFREICTPTGPDIIEYKTLLKSDNALQSFAINPQTDLAVIQYTGGTTGTPKGAMLTHSNLMTNVEQCAHWFSPLVAPGQEKFLAVLPFFHVFAMTVVMNLSLRVGGEIIIMFPRFNVLDALKLIHRHKITVMPAVPTVYSLINNHPQRARFDLSSVKACLSGSAPLPREVKQTFEAITGATLIEGYGLSEASPVVCGNPFKALNKPGSIGLPFPRTICKIVSLDDPHQEMPWGEKGQLLVKGPQVMAGYWHNSDATQEVLKDGFLHTGDIGYRDEEGHIFIVDRLKDMIINNGYNVYPRIVEESIYKHPAVEEVTVIGVPHEHRGEMVKAFVKLKAGHTLSAVDLTTFLQDKLSTLEIPKMIEFRDVLPKTLIGKLSKKELMAEEKTQRQRNKKEI